MATEITKSAKKTLAEAGEGAKEFVLKQSGFGDRLTGKEARRFLAGFTPSPKKVFSAQNIAGVSAGGAQLDLADPLGLRTGLETKLGLPGLRTKETGILGEQVEARATAREQQAALKQLPRESLGFIGTARSRAAEESAIQEQAIAERLGVAQAARLGAEQQLGIQFDILNQERTRTLNLAFQFPGAGISVNDNPETITGKLNKFKVSEEERIREQSQKDAFDQVFFDQFGSDRGKLSRKEARKKLKKKFKSDKQLEDKLNAMSLESSELQLQKLRQSLSDDDFNLQDSINKAFGINAEDQAIAGAVGGFTPLSGFPIEAQFSFYGIKE